MPGHSIASTLLRSMDTHDTFVKQAGHCWGWGNTNIEAILIAVRALKWLVSDDAEVPREMSMLL